MLFHHPLISIAFILKVVLLLRVLVDFFFPRVLFITFACLNVSLAYDSVRLLFFCSLLLFPMLLFGCINPFLFSILYLKTVVQMVILTTVEAL